MRVAVRHKDKTHPNHDWFAVSVGRIQGYTDLVSGKSYQAEEVATAVLRQAKEQFPEAEGYEHRVETLHVAGLDADGNERGEWHFLGKSQLPRVGEGRTVEHILETEQGQEASAE